MARVVAKLEPGGAQLSILELASALEECGVESRWLAGYSTPEGASLYRDAGVAVDTYGGGGDLQWRCDPGFASWLAPRLAGADLVHGHMLGGWCAAARAVADDIPLVGSEYNSYAEQARPLLREMRRALRRVDLFFAHGPDSRRLLRRLGLPPSRLCAGVPAVAQRRVRALPDLPVPRVVFAGRLHSEKGPDVLVAALAELDDPPATLVLGSGPLEGALRSSVRRAGLEGVVRFLGWQTAPERFIAGASALVVPSRKEAFSRAAVLAMALGVPVIGTSVEGLPKTLARRRGVLVPPKDPIALAAALDDVVAGRRRTDLVGARRFARRHEPRRVAPLYEHAYRSLVRSKAAADPC